jgi:hypothetical protein
MMSIEDFEREIEVLITQWDQASLASYQTPPPLGRNIVCLPTPPLSHMGLTTALICTLFIKYLFLHLSLHYTLVTEYKPTSKPIL